MSFDARHYGVVLCGGGPAATGVIVCAAQDGRLDELLEHGVFVIEKGESLAAGSIGHYRITGNTPASSFVRWLGTPESRDLFGAVAADPATEVLRSARLHGTRRSASSAPTSNASA